jgi:acetate---CoA ligase (ADP-forming) subunit beta
MTTTSKKEKGVRELLLKAVQNGQQALSEYDSKQVIAAAHVPITREVLVHSRQEAMDQAVRIGFPVVLKGSSHLLTHKTEMDMVRVKLNDAQDVGRAYDEITGKGIELDGILIQEMVKGHREFVIGLTREVKAAKLLDAFRGECAVDRDALIHALVGIGDLGMAHEDIAEIDINPLIVTGGNPVAVDALVILKTNRA